MTGLVVLDTGTDFTRAGQFVILALMQCGAFGIITFSTVFILLIGKKLSFRERDLLRTTVIPLAREDLMKILRDIVLLTFICEGVGTLLLWLRWKDIFGSLDAAYRAMFHAVSAYCNAGFALFSDSLIGFQGDVLTNIVHISLIIIGGIGFLVVIDCKRKIVNRKRLTLHSKLVLLTSAMLIIVGALGFFLLEHANVLQSATPGEKGLISLFQAVTPRTAGFNTVNIETLQDSTLFFLIMLMFIGASPGSTGGGIKTTCFGVLLLIARARLKGYSQVHLFGRTLPSEVVSKSVTVFFVSIIVIVLFTFTLSVIHPETRFLSVLFESVSAYGTVGLSAGMTGSLTPVSKILVSLLMFIGRVGPLTVALAVGQKRRRLEYSYAVEEVMVG